MITQSELKKLLHYNPSTGIFVWIDTRGNSVEIGGRAGCFNYRMARVIRVNGKGYYEHRLAFLYMLGYVPKNRITHIDGNRSNNIWDNLLEVKKYNGKLTQERLKELLWYDSKEGIFTRKVTKGGNPIGSVAGNITSNGYLDIKVDGKSYRVHRLAWLYMEGYFPKGIEIDHIDKDKTNNKWDNLRIVSRSCNMRNCSLSKANTSGVKGVIRDKVLKKWAAQMRVDGKTRKLGRFEDFDDAVCARLAGEQCVGWSGCDSNSPAYIYVNNNIQNKGI